MGLNHTSLMASLCHPHGYDFKTIVHNFQCGMSCVVLNAVFQKSIDVLPTTYVVGYCTLNGLHPMVHLLFLPVVCFSLFLSVCHSVCLCICCIIVVFSIFTKTLILSVLLLLLFCLLYDLLLLPFHSFLLVCSTNVVLVVVVVFFYRFL